MSKSRTIVICGAGIAGVSAAYYLLEQDASLNVILVDKNQPLSFTTSVSGENFRDFWPQECMRKLVSRSIELMVDLRNRHGSDSFAMEFSGYNFISRKKQPLIDHHSKVDLEIHDPQVIQNKYPFLDKGVGYMLRIKNAGRVDVNAMGMLMLREARKKGLRSVDAEITGIDQKGGTFHVKLRSGEPIIADAVVMAAGPFLNTIAAMAGITFPISNTFQRKFIMPDPKKIIPRDMPFTICTDPQRLEWSEKERSFFNSDEKYSWLLQEFPGGLHIKPDGNGIRMGWAFQRTSTTPRWEGEGKLDLFPQAVLKGIRRFIPTLAEYENNLPTPLHEYGGYYTRTKENWPLIGPTEIENVFVVGALSGFGAMAACAAGELCAKHLLEQKPLPSFAPWFHPARYDEPEIMKEINKLALDGQL